MFYPRITIFSVNNIELTKKTNISNIDVLANKAGKNGFEELN